MLALGHPHEMLTRTLHVAMGTVKPPEVFHAHALEASAVRVQQLHHVP